MADAELRALEREVAAGGDPAARVALAKQLERLGRRDDALQVLWRSHVVVLDPDDGIAPLAGRLHAPGQDGSVLCLEA